MATYVPHRIKLPNGLDQIGYEHSLFRLESESLGKYRVRLLEEIADPSGPTQEEYFRSTPRHVGFLRQNVFKLDVVRDSAGAPLAARPWVEVTANRLNLYTDETTVDTSCALLDRNDSYFLVDLVAKINLSSFFTATGLETEDEYKLSSKLLCGDNIGLVRSERLLPSRSNKLRHELVFDFMGSSGEAWQNAVGGAHLISQEGDYYLDQVNGVVFTYDNQAGYCTYTYLEYPWNMAWSEARGWALTSPDLDERIKDDLISDETGQPEPLALNSYGAELVNSLLKIHALSWGK